MEKLKSLSKFHWKSTHILKNDIYTIIQTKSQSFFQNYLINVVGK